MIARFFIAIGAPLVVFVRYLGEVVLLAADTFRSAFTHRLRWRLFLQQIVEIGLLSQVVVIVTGGFIVVLDINGTYYLANMVRWTRMRDLIMGVSKALVFGILIVFICCHKGLTTREGAVGVGRATTEAVVVSSLAVLISNFFLTMALNIVYPAGYQ